jgi:hypothetical protein
VGQNVFDVGGVTPPFEPPPFEQALRDHQAGGGVSVWAEKGLTTSPVRANPFTNGAATSEGDGTSTRPFSEAGSGNALLSDGSDFDEPEPEDNGSDSGAAWGEQPQGGTRAVARFSRDPEGMQSDAADAEEPLEAMLPRELEWIAPWVERGQAIKEVEELCGTGSVATQLEELAGQDAPVLREGLSNLRTQILNLQDPSKWPGNPEQQTEKQIAQREADKKALDFFALFTVQVLQRVEEQARKEERDRRQRELDGGIRGKVTGDAWGAGGGGGSSDGYQSPSGSPERLDNGGGGGGGGGGWGQMEQQQDSHGMGGMEAPVQVTIGGGAHAGQAAAAGGAEIGGYGDGGTGRTGIFVTFEGYLMKKTASKPHRWHRKWFSIVTKENNGLVDSRTMQYYDKKPPAGRETEVEAAHGIILPPERLIEPYDKKKFRLRIKPTDPTERVYCFQTETAEECDKWMAMLNDESKPSASRRGGLGQNHQNFLNEARGWILDVYKKHKPGKLKDVDVLLAEWVGEEEELLEKIVEKYNPKYPPPQAPAAAFGTGNGNVATLNRLMS